MAKFPEFFSRQDVGIFLFCLFLALLSWPFISIANRESSEYSIIVYLFLIWSLIIAFLFVIGRCCQKHSSTNENTW